MALVLLMEKSAVSDAEKNPDKRTKISNITIWLVMAYIPSGYKHGNGPKGIKKAGKKAHCLHGAMGIKMDLPRFVGSP